MKFVVCIKQVPAVSELPWDPQTGTLMRDLAEGIMNPACKHALEAAIQLKETLGGHITAITMGPPAAEEILHEAIAMGADKGVLLTDLRMAGGDTLVTSHTLGMAIAKVCPDVDLILCGCHTSDSETAQVGPQLAVELDVPSVAYVEHLKVLGTTLTMRRLADNFLETLEMDLPGLVTMTTKHYQPRYVSLGGLNDAFLAAEILILNADDLGLDPERIGIKGSATRIRNVYAPKAQKENVVLKGAVKHIVEELFARFGDRIAGAIGKDLDGRQ